MAENSNAGPRAFGGVVALMAVIAGLYAMVEPMNQKMSYHHDRLEAHSGMRAHDWALEALALITERFKEVETQFRSLRDVGRKTEERTNARLTKIESKLIRDETRQFKGTARVATLEQQIKALEREVFVVRIKKK